MQLPESTFWASSSGSPSIMHTILSRHVHSGRITVGGVREALNAETMHVVDQVSQGPVGAAAVLVSYIGVTLAGDTATVKTKLPVGNYTTSIPFGSFEFMASFLFGLFVDDSPITGNSVICNLFLSLWFSSSSSSSSPVCEQ